MASTKWQDLKIPTMKKSSLVKREARDQAIQTRTSSVTFKEPLIRDACHFQHGNTAVSKKNISSNIEPWKNESLRNESWKSEHWKNESQKVENELCKTEPKPNEISSLLLQSEPWKSEPYENESWKTEMLKNVTCRSGQWRTGLWKNEPWGNESQSVEPWKNVPWKSNSWLFEPWKFDSWKTEESISEIIRKKLESIELDNGTDNTISEVGRYVNWSSQHSELSAKAWCRVGELGSFCNRYEYITLISSDIKGHCNICNEIRSLLNGAAPFHMRKRFPSNIRTAEDLWICIGLSSGVEYHLNRILKVFRRPLEWLSVEKQRDAKQDFELAIKELRLDISARVSQIKLYDREVFERKFQLEWESQ